ncbi:hypothetical protein V8E52_003982 [Russula decolorans]
MSSSEGAVSSIQTFTSIPAEKTSHISSVGADISARSTISSFPPNPPPVDFSTISESSSKSSRPRPRPIFSRARADPAPSTSVSDPVFPHVPGSDLRDQFAIGSHSDPTVTRELTQNINPDLNNFSPDIAERAKMRARKATKRSSPYAEEVIDITDDELAVTPTRKPKERVKPRPIKRSTPVGNNLQLDTDPVTVPVPSSSPLLPPSDPFPESTVINSTPPRPHPPVEAAAPDSPSQESPIQPRKRKRTARLHSPVDNPPAPNCPPAVPDRVTSPRSNSLPPSEGVVDVVDLGQNLNSDKKSSEDGYEMTETPKKRKSSKSAEKGSDSAAARSESSRVGKSKKKTIVEVVIKSPRKRRTESKKAKAKKKDSRNPEGNDTAVSRNDHPPSSPRPAEQTHRPVEDKDVHASRRQRSDSDDELILAPSSKVKPQKGKRKTREPHPVDSDAPSEINSSNEQVATGKEEEEEPRNHEHHAEGANTRTNAEHNSRSCAAEPESPAPLLGKMKHNVSAQEDVLPKPSPTRETPAPGKLRYSLSRSDRKTPMQELIRRAASHPNAPFSNPGSPIASPLAKTSKSALRRIAPLHLTRRTPPPPLPRPPPPKKSKKMLALEEKWEMELEDEVEGWWALTDEERQDWRRSKRDKELGYDD